MSFNKNKEKKKDLDLNRSSIPKNDYNEESHVCFNNECSIDEGEFDITMISCEQ